MGKLCSIGREIERHRRRCKYIRIKDANGAFILNSAHKRRQKKHEHMSKNPIREDRNANKLDSNNELTHTTNKNRALPSSNEEEQKPSLVGGRRVEVCSCSSSRMGRRMDLKTSMSDSSTTIWRWMVRHAMMEQQNAKNENKEMNGNWTKNKRN